ncbi:MAG: type I restriction endonuclease subunit S [Pseudomonas sp. PGPPP3]|nr:MAG: type I restriction endonuclease subunit S [Pseudomonas sp. PGPPP3]
MSSDWPLIKLSELCLKITDGAHQSPKSVTTGKPMASVKDLTRFGVDISNARLISEEDFNVLIKQGCKPEVGDVLIAKDGNSALDTVCSVDAELDAVLLSSVAILRPDKSKVLTSYLKYYLSSADVIDYLKSNFISGAAIPRVVLKDFKKADIRVPPLPEQETIASVLEALDSRIKVLRETNATLEAIAQALFKSWFVDFDPVRAKAEGLEPQAMDAPTAALFPDSFEESQLGLVPKGWRVGVLSDCCERVESGGTPKRTAPEYWGGEVPWLTSGEVRKPIVLNTKEKITELGVNQSSAKIWPQGTTVVAMYGATAGEVCLLANPSTANQACCGLIPRVYSRAFTFICARRERAALASKSSGSAQQNLNKGLVSNHPVLLPPKEVLSVFEDVAGAALDGWIASEQQTQTLTQLRDTLLPRLISGQLRLPDAEQAVEEALA